MPGGRINSELSKPIQVCRKHIPAVETGGKRRTPATWKGNWKNNPEVAEGKKEDKHFGVKNNQNQCV